MIRDFFIKNRNKYFDQVETDSVSVLFSGNVYQKSADSDYPFEVNKNFYYLTGINQANSKLIMVKGKEKTFTYLFIDEYDELQAKWVGKTLTSNEATDISGIDEVLFNKDFNKTFSSFINPHRRSVVIADKIYLDLERRVGVDSIGQGLAFSKDIKKQYPEISLLNNYHIIVSLRMIKEDDEIRVIKKSIETTKNALKKVMENLEPDLFENQIEAIFDMAIKWENKTHAFDTICASGKNATILHYVDNNQRMINGDLVLFDLGARTEFYVSDISRTYPINGKFNRRQKEVYEVVLEVNKKCIEYLRPGLSWIDYNKYANSLLIEGLKKLGKIKEDKELVKYYWHSIGHSIGLDTHDPVIATDVIKENMVVTVEPGLYLEDEDIGIRIEDNVLVTKDGPVNLSKDIIKEVKDIEEFMKNK